MKVFGVIHETREKGLQKGRPTPEIKALLAKLEEYNVKRLGAEGLAEHYDERLRPFRDRTTPVARYFYLLGHMARKRGIELIPLEEGQEDSRLHSFQGVINRIADDKSLKENEQVKDVNKYFGSRTDLHPVLRAMFVEVLKKYPRLTKENAHAVRCAISFSRSMKMYENAKKLKLDFLVVGAGHAIHLEHEGVEHIRVFGSDYSRDAYNGNYVIAFKRKQFIQPNLPLVNRLRRIAATY